MVSSLLLIVTTMALGAVVSWRWFGTRWWWEALSLAPLWACLFVIAGANTWGPVAGRAPTAGLAGLLALVLCFWPRPESPQEPLLSAAPSRRWWTVLVLTVGCAVGYIVYAQFFTLDTDNWIHEPLIAGYTLGIFPPVHPFFPEVEMHGHYGRDLAIGALLPAGTDPLVVVWWLNPVLALASCGTLLAIFRRWGDSPSAQLAALAFPFFGVCVGVRVGLSDSFDGNNGMVYALAVGLFHAMLTVFELLPGGRPATPFFAPITAGGLLGVYQLVYETHFGLFLLSGAVLLGPALQRSVRPGRLLAGVALTVVVALGVACTEGGPMTSLAQGKSSATQTDNNKSQHVSMTFPKEALFQVLATSADYQRISAGFRLEPFRDWLPEISGEGYLSIFSPAFLVTHWLPLFCAPFTLVWLIRRRHGPGLAFWVFGAWAYLVPGLIDFGPLYEWEYFRWEFAAGFALSVPLGLWCGSLIDTSEETPRNQRRLCLALGWSLLILGLWPGEKMVNRAIITWQKQGWPPLASPGEWRVARPELGVTSADLALAKVLCEQILPGEVVLTNLGSETPLGLWPDCVVSAWTGARVAGRAHPPEGRRVHAHPNYHRSALAKALQASGRPDLLWNTDVTWLWLDPTTTPLAQTLPGSPFARLVGSVDEAGASRQLWKLSPPPSLAASRVPAEVPSRFQVRLLTEQGAVPQERLGKVEWRCGQAYRLSLAAFNATEAPSRLGWLRLSVRDSQGRMATDPLTYLLGANPLPPQTGDMQEVVFVTPLVEGAFTVQGELLTEEGPVPWFEFPLDLTFQRRLEALEGSLEGPGETRVKAFFPLRLQLESGAELRSEGELELLTRMRVVDGDYVWELDRVSMPLSLTLSAGGSQVIEWKTVAPAHEGAYDVELEILDQATGARVALQPSTRIVVSP